MRRNIRWNASIGCGCAPATGCAPTSGTDSSRGSSIPRILEFYAATEGNVSLYNVEGKVGAVGRVPPFLTHRFPLALVKFDTATAAPARDASGRCIRCATGEIGEAIGRIGKDAKRPGGEFEGYTKSADTESKILRNVFEEGDAWYRTGDLMRMDRGRLLLFRRSHRRHLPLEG